MHDKKHARPRVFTVEEANATLPLVRAITRDLSALANDLVDRRQRLDSLLGGRKPSATDVYGDELADMVKSVERDSHRIAAYVKELESLGVEAKGAVDGLVDFPAMLEGRMIYLCWRLGESEVLHWHEVDAGFAGRQTLVAASPVGASSVGASALGDREGLDPATDSHTD